MARITVEDCLTRVPNRFALVMLVAKRTKQMLKGSQPVIPLKENKHVVGSLREVALGAVSFENPDGVDLVEEIQLDLSRNRPGDVSQGTFDEM